MPIVGALNEEGIADTCSVEEFCVKEVKEDSGDLGAVARA